MDRVKSQAAVVSQLLFDPKTASAYKDVLTLTGKIIKEIALLVWLLICSVLVFGAWFSDTAISAGQNARQWWQSQQTESVDGNQAAAATGQAFLDVGQNGATFLLDKAREQLGLEKIERSDKKSAVAAVKPDVKTAVNSTSKVADKVAVVAKDATTKEVSKPKTSSETSATDQH